MPESEQDKRIARLERLSDRALRELGSVRGSLGTQNKTLMFELDERYMTREDLGVSFVTHKEHEETLKVIGELDQKVDMLTSEVAQMTESFRAFRNALYGAAAAIVTAAVLVIILGQHP